MEPLTALGIATNVVQFVDFASKLLGKSKEIYKSASTASEDNIVLDIVVRDIQRLNGSISVPEGCSDALEGLREESNRISQELLAVLEKLRVKGKKTKWKSFVIAVRGVWSLEKVESMAARLDKLQAQTTAHLQVLIGNEIAKISLAMDHLKSIDVRLGLSQAVERSAFREELVQSVEKVIQEKLHDAYRSENAVPQLAEHVNLNNVIELSTTMSMFHEELGSVEAKLSNKTRDYQMLETLYFDNIWARRDRIPRAYSDTFTWIFKSVLPDSNKPVGFVEWLREGGDIFWIHGKPGSGKSTLMKFLVHHPHTAAHLQAWAKDGRLVVASFFFWHSGTKLQKSQEGLLRSLLFEILRQFPALLAGVYEIITSERHGSQSAAISSLSDSWMYSHITDATWSLPNLFKAFEYIRGQEITAKFCFFIDGLDEYKDEDNNGPRDLIRVMRGLAESPNIKLCLSSRTWAVFKDSFGSKLELTIQLEDLTRRDIRHYVMENFESHEQFQKLVLMDSAYADLVEEVVRKAQGVFLWVFLVVRDLLEGLTYNDTVNIMRQRLDRFPSDLDTYFRHIFDSISKVYRAQTARSFQVAMSREEPLPLMSYSFVDDVEEDPGLNCNTVSKLSTEQVASKLAVMSRRIEGRSKGLLEVVVSNGSPSHSVDFLHRTVRDFLEHSLDIQGEMMESLESRHETWVLLCRATSAMMMSWQEASVVDYLRQLFYFARLAVSESGEDDIVDDILLQIFPGAYRLTLLRGIPNGVTNHEEDGLPDIFLGCQYGLVSYVKRQLTQQLQLIEKQPSAVRQRKKASVLDRMLRHALLGGDSYSKFSPELVEYLVSLGSSPNHLCSLGNRDCTVFYHFLSKIEKKEISSKKKGVLEILKMLVAHGANLQAGVQADAYTYTGYPGLDSTRESRTRRARHIIYECFTVDQAEWIISGSKEGAPAESGDSDVREFPARSRNENSLHFHPVENFADFYAQTGIVDKEYRMYSPITQASTMSTPYRLHGSVYAVKVDNVSREAIFNASGGTHNGIIQSLSEENNVMVVNVVWLGKTETRNLNLRVYGSIIVYLGSSDDVSQLLSCGTFRVAGQQEVKTAPETSPSVIQCSNCQQLGHTSSICWNAMVCAKCANTGHHHSSCHAAFMRCTLCGGFHLSFSQSCPKRRYLG